MPEESLPGERSEGRGRGVCMCKDSLKGNTHGQLPALEQSCRFVVRAWKVSGLVMMKSSSARLQPF